MSLQDVSPQAASFWHPTKNGDVKASDVSPFSQKRFWFYCPKTCNEGCIHEWETRIIYVVRSPQCTFCDGYKFCKHESFAGKNPDLLKYWNFDKNEMSPYELSLRSAKKVWWICDKGCQYGCLHEWEATVDKIASGRRCPYCAHQKMCYHESLHFKFPDVVKLWHPEKNGELDPKKLPAYSHTKIWCLCPIGCEHGCKHEWTTAVSNLSNGTNCPFCVGKKICYHQSLEYKYPDIAKQWHPTKNNDVKPSEVSSGSSQKAWWICPEKHEWCINISCRTSQNTNCPKCKRKTEKKMLDWLERNYKDITITSEGIFDWCKSQISEKHYYKFDFVLKELKLIIEVDGLQHIRDVFNWQSHDITREYDIYKMKKAIENGYSVVRVLQEDVYYNRNNWEMKLSSVIRSFESPCVIFIDYKNQYKKHMETMEEYVTL